MFMFTLSMQIFSYFLASCCPNLKSANSVSYGLVLLAIVIESFIQNDSFIQFIYTDNTSKLIVFLKYFLTLYPPFSYTKVNKLFNIRFLHQLQIIVATILISNYLYG
jgi:hypothetical protein